ncbi:MAG: ferrochelatase, partial [Alphaproteobacteria bacterium]
MNAARHAASFEPDPRFTPEGHPKVAMGRIGVLLINLGTPDGTGYWEMRRYLKEFLSDRRVIEVNPLAWWFILNGPVLTKRPFSSGEAYRSIWNTEKDESPLRTITRSQAEKLAEAFAGDARVVVDWGMRYGNPSTKSRIEALKEQGCERILLFALYPQYAAATTATAYDKAFDALKTMRWQPAVRTVPPYHDDPVYIAALATSLEQELQKLPWKPEVILASFHGLPKAYFEKGDPYHCHCAKTTRLLREKLGWSEDYLRMTFQSRFGKDEWLQPYTDKTVEALAREGVRNLA